MNDNYLIDCKIYTIYTNITTNTNQFVQKKQNITEMVKIFVRTHKLIVENPPPDQLLFKRFDKNDFNYFITL
jgi:hypothetical protein